MNLETNEKRERTLSCFFARELFLLYVEDKLESQRQSLLKNHVAKCAACALALDKITTSRDLILELAKTRPTPALVDYVRKEQHFWSEFFDQAGWKNWPSTIQWAAQLSLVASVLVVTIHYFPWLNFARSLHKMQRRAVVQQPVAALPTDNLSNTDSLEPAAPTSFPKVAKTDNRIPYGPPSPPEIVALNQKATKTVSVVTNQPVTETAKADTTASLATDTEKTDPGSTVPKMAGFVWKGSLKVEKVNDEVALRVNQIVTSLGGVKAGQVELGWHRGDQRYYHFILPEENYDKLLSSLNSEGLVTLTKEPHPRVIKSGHMRIIMTVEEAE